jgi:hypothetical protein
MLTWASLALAVLKLINSVMGYFNQEALIQSGHDKAIAEVSAEIMKKTAAGKSILEKVNAMSDDEVDAGLHGLEPK